MLHIHSSKCSIACYNCIAHSNNITILARAFTKELLGKTHYSTFTLRRALEVDNETWDWRIAITS